MPGAPQDFLNGRNRGNQARPAGFVPGGACLGIGGLTFGPGLLPTANGMAKAPQDLCIKVKDIQKTDGGNEAWTLYLEKHSHTRRDPARHEQQFLQDLRQVYLVLGEG